MPVYEEAPSESLFDLVDPRVRAVAGTSLLACAAVYVAAGLLCLGRLKRGAPPRTGLLPGVLHLAWCLTCAASRIRQRGMAHLAHCGANLGARMLSNLQCAWMHSLAEGGGCGAARSRREAERVKVTGEMAALEAKRRELQGLLATYSAD